MPKSTKSYAQLLDGLKAMQGTASEIQTQVRGILSELNTDLKNINLLRLDQVVPVVEAKFDESGFSDAEITTSAPKDRATLIASTTLGTYPSASFNVEVSYENGHLTVYFWPVPKDGNLR